MLSLSRSGHCLGEMVRNKDLGTEPVVSNMTRTRYIINRSSFSLDNNFQGTSFSPLDEETKLKQEKELSRGHIVSEWQTSI